MVTVLAFTLSNYHRPIGRYSVGKTISVSSRNIAQTFNITILPTKSLKITIGVVSNPDYNRAVGGHAVGPRSRVSAG